MWSFSQFFSSLDDQHCKMKNVEITAKKFRSKLIFFSIALKHTKPNEKFVLLV